MNQEQILQACAAEIQKMLAAPDLYQIPQVNPDQTVSCRPVQPGDIAVLAYQKRNAASVRKILASMNIASVFVKGRNIYASSDAWELYLVLKAVLQPNSRELVMNALATPVCGVPIDRLVQANEDPQSGELFIADMMEVFLTLNQLWKKSFLQMFQELFRHFHVRERYPALPDGERKLTNLLQLQDLLYQEILTDKCSPETVVSKLARRIQKQDQLQGPPFSHSRPAADENSEQTEEQLETDRNAVQLMTIHSSKGLEFPIVLLPDFYSKTIRKLFSNAAADRTPYKIHMPDGSAAFDLLCQKENLIPAASESLQEDLRLAYVAFTRAKYKTLLFRGKNDTPSCLDWLFVMKHLDPLQFPSLANPEYAAQCVQLLLSKGGTFEEAYLNHPFCRKLDPDFVLQKLPSCEKERPLTLPELHLFIDRNWQMASYTTLTPANFGTSNAPDSETFSLDYDDDDEIFASDENSNPTISSGSDSIFTIPGGAILGNAWHKILQELDYQENPGTIQETVERQMRLFGLVRDQDLKLRNNRCTLTSDMLQKLFLLPFHGQNTESFRLCDIPKNQRIPEFEFTFSLKRGFTGKDIQKILAPWIQTRFHLSPESWPDWNREISGGFLTGFIDLFFCWNGKFYLLDWKSNRLGGNAKSFNAQSICQEMIRHFYFIQYFLYLTAAVKYLRFLNNGKMSREIYQEKIGGIFYVFLRGAVLEDPGRALFFDLPPYETVETLEQLFTPEGLDS